MTEYALILGINRYKDEENITQLKWARGDAEVLHSVFTSSRFCCIPSQNVTILVDENATRENILKSIEEISAKARKDDTVFFHFSGHGCSVPDDVRGDEDDRLVKYLVPCDAKAKNLIASAIDFKFLPEYFDRIHAERKIVTLDCCYSGAAGGRTFLIPGFRQVGSFPVGQLFLQNAFGIGRAIITACASNELAREDDRIHHGILSYCLIQGLQGQADFRNDGIVDFNELWTYIADEIPRISGDKQHPIMVSWVRGPYFELSRPKGLSCSLEEKKEIESNLVIKYAKYRLQTVKMADDSSFEKLGFEGAEYLNEKLTHNSKISVSCGRTLSETISQMSKKTLHNVEMYPLNVYLSDVVEIIDSNILTALLMTRFSGMNSRAHLLPAYGAEFKERISRVFEMAIHSDLFLFGIGQPAVPNANVAYVLRQAGLTQTEFQELGVVGEINFHLYDRDGQFLISKTSLPQNLKEYLEKYYRQFFALPIEGLKEVAKKPGVDLIAIAGGNDKRDAILGAIKGEFVRTLITDAETAQWLAYEAEI